MKRAAGAIALMFVAWPVHAGEKSRVVELWPGKAPEEPGTIDPEKQLMSKETVKAQVEITEPMRLMWN